MHLGTVVGRFCLWYEVMMFMAWHDTTDNDGGGQAGMATIPIDRCSSLFFHSRVAVVHSGRLSWVFLLECHLVTTS